MKRSPLWAYGLIFLAVAVFFVGRALAQTPCDQLASAGECVDAALADQEAGLDAARAAQDALAGEVAGEKQTNAAQAAALAAHTAEIERLTGETAALRAEVAGHETLIGGHSEALVERAQIDAAIGLQIIEINLRLDALEDGAGEPPPPPPLAEPNTADGKPIMQLGLSGLATIEEPFINLLRMTGNDWTAVQKWPGPNEMKMGALLAGGFIDRQTMLPNAVPPGFDMVRSGLFRDARDDPAAYAGTYVVEWRGAREARIELGCQTHQTLIEPGSQSKAGRLEFTCPETDRDWTRLLFSGLGPEGLEFVRVYRKEDEALVRAGAEFSPRFLAYAGRYKVLRTLDIQGAVVAAARSVDQLAKKSHGQWAASPWINAEGLPMGPPIEVLFDMAVAADAALWMHVSGPLGAPAVFDEIALQGPRHQENFDKQLAKAWAGTRAPEILASPEWDKYADEVVRSLIASNYPETRALYIETANEVWNNANPFWWYRDYFTGIRDWANAQKPIEGFGPTVGAGFMEGRFAVALDKALAKAGRRQAVVFVLAAQHANPFTSAGAIAGFKHYFALAGIDPAPYLKRAGLATATYFQEGTSGAGLFKAASEAELKGKWLAAIKADPEGTAKALTDWYLSVDQCCTVPYLVRLRRAHEAVAASGGIGFIGDYEGESHEAAFESLRTDPTFKTWYFNVWMDGPDGERLTREWVRALYAENPQAIISNYKGACPRQIQWPWCDGLIGEETGRTRALSEFLRNPE